MSNIAKKLMMKAGEHWLLYHAPKTYLALLSPLPDGLTISNVAEGNFKGIQLFVANSVELADALPTISPLLQPNTILWIVYPKKSSGIDTDLQMMSSWDEPTKYGLTSVAAAAIDDTWTALRFKKQDLIKASNTSNSAIANNEYAAYIDLVNKKVTLPADVAEILQNEPTALANFQKLSYSNQKEYVLWIVSAKQDKTRADRLLKMVDKLLNGKKNPADK